ncbi:MAG: hypothetical protein ACRD1N_08035 [Terriglobia bacterium]
MNAARLRAQLESSLSDRFPSPFTYHRPSAPETISVPALEALAGGLPRGGLTEICGPESSGRTALLLSVLAQAAGEFFALVDGRDMFDPHSAAAAGVDLKRLLWVRCTQAEQALRAAETLLGGGGFGIVALDLASIPTPVMRRIPLSIWFRLRWSVRDTRTALIVLEREPTVGTSASLVVRLNAESVCWSTLPESRATPPGACASCRPAHARLLSGMRSNAEALRSRSSPKFSAANGKW